MIRALALFVTLLAPAAVAQSNVNEDMEFLADIYAMGGQSMELARADAIDAAVLSQGGLDSLRAVDAHLNAIYLDLQAGKTFSNKAIFNAAYLAAAHTADVMINEAPSLNAYSHEDWIALHPNFVEHIGAEPSVYTMIVVANDASFANFPMNSAFGFLENGAEDSMYFFANAALATLRNQQEDTQ